MSGPRIEEVEDDDEEEEVDVADPDEMDLEAFDFARPGANTLQPSSFSHTPSPPPTPSQSQSQPRPPPSREAHQARLARERELQAHSKTFQCLYPIYFDARRSRDEGRRVKKALAVENPLAREIADACGWAAQKTGVRLEIVFEPHKCHPRDWGNPGRVRVGVKEAVAGGAKGGGKLGGKHHLYLLVAEYLKLHPTTKDTPRKFVLHGMPPELLDPTKDLAPAVPRGVKMGTILPLHSPALSGGGVNENFLKDVMSEMGAGGGAGGGGAPMLPPGMEGMAGLANMFGGAGAGGPAGGGGGGSAKKVKVVRKK